MPGCPTGRDAICLPDLRCWPVRYVGPTTLLVRFAVIYCALAVCNPALPDAADADNTSVPRTGRVTEPVFGGQAYVEQWGDSADPPVILVHGLGRNGARDWQRLAPALAVDHFVVAFDLPGFGRSDAGNHRYSPQSYTRFVRWVADTYVGRPFVLIGHSMGGAIALNYAATHQRHVSRLILIDTAGVLHRVAFSSYLLDEFRPTWWWDVLPKTNSGKLRALLGVDLADLETWPVPVDALLNTAIARRIFLGGNPAKIAGLALVQHDFSGRLEQITAPTLVIWGERDGVAPLRTGRLLAHRIADARLVTIPEAGHVPMTDAPDALNRLVIDELAAVPAAPAPLPAESVQRAPGAGFAPDGECRGENDVRFTGRYATLTIVQCQHVTIEAADIGFLEIRSASVEMLDSRIIGAERALSIDSAILVATASDFTADIPITIHDSRLDFAGVTITARRRPVAATASSTALFSISELRLPESLHRLHGVYVLSESRSLP